MIFATSILNVHVHVNVCQLRFYAFRVFGHTQTTSKFRFLEWNTFVIHFMYLGIHFMYLISTRPHKLVSFDVFYRV